ncbi:MAG TPA: NAD(P)-dependent oxidoreductase [Burkholderiales bacterium]|nr:NAD(P)-dependent oxidoreductase [Burkholderiales bacterium]
MKAGYLGVGNMGQPMAARLLDAGHELWIHDRREAAMQPLLARQAQRAASARELGERCETVVVSLPTLEAFRQAVTGPAGLLEGAGLKTLVNTCTVGAVFLDEMVEACAAKGVTVVDAPITGGPAVAAAGALAVMVSGEPARVAQLRPLFECWGKTIVVAGDRPGAAQILKLTNNILFAVSLVASSEALVMGARGGLGMEAMLQVINNGSGRNFTTLSVIPKSVVPGTFDFGAPLEMLVKDVDLAIEQGEALGVPMWVCQATRLFLRHALYQGRGSHDLSRIIQIVEDGTARG